MALELTEVKLEEKILKNAQDVSYKSEGPEAKVHSPLSPHIAFEPRLIIFIEWHPGVLRGINGVFAMLVMIRCNPKLCTFNNFLSTHCHPQNQGMNSSYFWGR